jgi:hypothetical protein
MSTSKPQRPPLRNFGLDKEIICNQALCGQPRSEKFHMKNIKHLVAGALAGAALAAAPALALAAPAFAAPVPASQAVQTAPCPHPPECLSVRKAPKAAHIATKPSSHPPIVESAAGRQKS